MKRSHIYHVHNLRNKEIKLCLTFLFESVLLFGCRISCIRLLNPVTKHNTTRKLLNHRSSMFKISNNASTLNICRLYTDNYVSLLKFKQIITNCMTAKINIKLNVGFCSNLIIL